MSIAHFSFWKNYKAQFCLVFLLFPLVSHGQRNEVQPNNLLIDTTFQLNEDPNSLLIETVSQLIPGKALDLGMGTGRNSIYLAVNGWDVTGVDMTDDGLTFGFAEASKSKVNIDAIVSSAKPGDLGTNEWDLIVHVYKGCLTEPRVSRISNALKSGGLLVFEFFHREAGIEMKGKMVGCETNSIKKAIEQSREFNIVRYNEEEGVADYGMKNYKLVKLIAAKK